jgi:hypothetical protein
MRDFSTDDSEPSDEQAHLVGMGDNLLGYLGAIGQALPKLGMSPEGILQYVNACNGAYWFAFNARLFDHRLQNERNRQYFDGGGE